MNQSVFTITIPRFLEHNPKARKSFPYFMLSKSFFNDDKISRCTPGMIALYVYLMNVCADYASGTIKVCVNSVPGNLKVGVRFAEVLVRLEELQLLTIEKNEAFVNRIERNRKERKGREVSDGSEKENATEKNRTVFEAYKQAYQLRYKVEPIKNAKTNSAISQLVKRVGPEEAILLVQFFLTHNKQYYLQTMHDISACLKDAEGLRTQRLRGRTILDKDVRDFAQQASFNQLLDDVERGGF